METAWEKREDVLSPEEFLSNVRNVLRSKHPPIVMIALDGNPEDKDQRIHIPLKLITDRDQQLWWMLVGQPDLDVALTYALEPGRVVAPVAVYRNGHKLLAAKHLFQQKDLFAGSAYTKQTVAIVSLNPVFTVDAST